MDRGIFRIRRHCQRESNENWRAWLELWFDFWCACSTWCDPVHMNPWCYWIGFGNNGTLQSQRSSVGIPSIRKPASRDYFSFRWLWELMSVSCTTNSLARTCDFRKCIRFRLDVVFESSRSPAKLNVGIIPICIVVQCCTHENNVWIHLWDLPIRTKYKHFRTICEHTIDILQQILFLLRIDGHHSMELRLWRKHGWLFCSPVQNISTISLRDLPWFWPLVFW